MKYTFLSIILIFSLLACNNEPENQANDSESELSGKEIDSENLLPDDKIFMFQVADTLYYTAQLKAANEEEALYMNDWVKNLKLKKFTDMIFKAVYDGRLTAYSYISEEPLSAEEVKAIEAENADSEIAKLLFEEAWFFDEKNLRLYKEVRSIMLAYERKDSEGVVKGYKSGIKIYLGDHKPM